MLIIGLEPSMTVIAEASSGEEAIARFVEHRPDVTLMDLQLPGMNGLQAINAIRRLQPDARIIVLTSFTDEEQLLPALQAGAAGYLLKNAEPSELARAVRAAHAGEAVLDTTVAARLLDSIAEPADAQPREALTPREREVLALIARGYANKRIALELGIAEKTVKTHVGHVLAKLGVADRTQAALHAARAGLTRS